MSGFGAFGAPPAGAPAPFGAPAPAFGQPPASTAPPFGGGSTSGGFGGGAVPGFGRAGSATGVPPCGAGTPFGAGTAPAFGSGASQAPAFSVLGGAGTTGGAPAFGGFGGAQPAAPPSLRPDAPAFVFGGGGGGQAAPSTSGAPAPAAPAFGGGGFGGGGGAPTFGGASHVFGSPVPAARPPPTPSFDGGGGFGGGGGAIKFGTGATTTFGGGASAAPAPFGGAPTTTTTTAPEPTLDVEAEKAAALASMPAFVGGGGGGRPRSGSSAGGRGRGRGPPDAAEVAARDRRFARFWATTTALAAAAATPLPLDGGGGGSGVHPTAPGDDDDPSLRGAIVGTCASMCPPSEVERRERIEDVSMFERPDLSVAVAHPALAVKKFARTVDQDPATFRTRAALDTTQAHLRTIMDRTDVPLSLVHRFLWDRYRGVRQDLFVQGMGGAWAASLIEEHVRFMLLAEHELCELTPQAGEAETFDSHLNLEQVNKALITLGEVYDAAAAEGTPLPHEPEFRSYHVLTLAGTHGRYRFNAATLQDALAAMRRDVLASAPVQRALRIARAVAAGDWAAYFRELAAAPYLTACLAHVYARHVRAAALETLAAAVGGPGGGALPLEDVSRALGLETETLALETFQSAGLVLTDDGCVVLPRGLTLDADALPKRRCPSITRRGAARRSDDARGVADGRGGGVVGVAPEAAPIARAPVAVAAPSGAAAAAAAAAQRATEERAAADRAAAEQRAAEHRAAADRAAADAAARAAAEADARAAAEAAAARAAAEAAAQLESERAALAAERERVAADRARAKREKAEAEAARAAALAAQRAAEAASAARREEDARRERERCEAEAAAAAAARAAALAACVAKRHARIARGVATRWRAAAREAARERAAVERYATALATTRVGPRVGVAAPRPRAALPAAGPPAPQQRKPRPSSPHALTVQEVVGRLAPGLAAAAHAAHAPPTDDLWFKAVALAAPPPARDGGGALLRSALPATGRRGGVVTVCVAGWPGGGARRVRAAVRDAGRLFAHGATPDTPSLQAAVAGATAWIVCVDGGDAGPAATGPRVRALLAARPPAAPPAPLLLLCGDGAPPADVATWAVAELKAGGGGRAVSSVRAVAADGAGASARAALGDGLAWLAASAPPPPPLVATPLATAARARVAAALTAASTDWRATPLTLVDAARGALAALAADAAAAAVADAAAWPPTDALAADDDDADVAGPQPGWASAAARVARETALATAGVPPFPAAALATGDAAAARAAVASFCDRLAGGGGACDPPPPDLTDWRADLQEAIYTALGRLDGCGVRVVVDAAAAARAAAPSLPRLRAPLERSPAQNGGGGGGAVLALLDGASPLHPAAAAWRPWPGAPPRSTRKRARPLSATLPQPQPPPPLRRPSRSGVAAAAVASMSRALADARATAASFGAWLERAARGGGRQSVDGDDDPLGLRGSAAPPPAAGGMAAFLAEGAASVALTAALERAARE